MSYENNRYIDEGGERLMDMEEPFHSDDDVQPNQMIDDEIENNENWRKRDRSPTPVYNESVTHELKSKPKKRLVKKGMVRERIQELSGYGEGYDVGSVSTPLLGEDIDQPSSSGHGKKKIWRDERVEEKRKEKVVKKRKHRADDNHKIGMERGLGSVTGDQEEMEMWDRVAGGNSEDDQEGLRNMDDDNFIDDSGLDPEHRFGSDNEARSPGEYAQASEGEEEDELKKLFSGGRKKKKIEKSAAEISLLVEKIMAELEVTAELDAQLNRESKPAINKLKKLPLLTDVLSKKHLQQEFLDHGVLTVLKNWLEPLPDGSLPNTNIRAAILNILTDYPIDLEQADRRDQLKLSGLGKVIMFLSKSDEETTANRKLAKDLVDKWSRPIFKKSTRYEDMRNFDKELIPVRRPPVKKPVPVAPLTSRDDDLDLPEFSQKPKLEPGSSRQHATRPEAMSMDFIVRPQSKIDPDLIRARAKQAVCDQRRLKMSKKLQRLKAPKRQLQATKLSVEGRGMTKYL